MMDEIPVVPLYTAQQLRDMDAKTIKKLGVPGIVLMETAGAAVAEILMGDFNDPPILVLCGQGNNGGDGWVVARKLLNAGVEHTAWLLGDASKVKGDAKIAMEAYKKHGGKIDLLKSSTLSRFRKTAAVSSVGVDALFGTGLNAPVEGLAAKAIDAMNEIPTVIAVDIPSGIHADTGMALGAAIIAEITVTFGGIKVGCVVTPGIEYAGDTIVVDIGIPPQAIPPTDHYEIDEEVLEQIFPPRRIAGHKGDYGHALILAGAKGKTGACRLATESALRMGAGLATQAVPNSLASIYASGLREAMTVGLPDEDSGRFAASALPAILDACRDKTALLIGPGINNDAGSRKILETLLEVVEIPIVIDADGLNALAQIPKWTEHLAQRVAPTLLTPHPGEMARLAGVGTADVQNRRVDLAREGAKKSGAIIILKGARTVIASPEGDICINPTGNPTLATAGTGDVLAGILCGLLAQRHDPFWSACAGVFYHGYLADQLVEEGRRRILAGDLIERIGVEAPPAGDGGCKGGCCGA